MRIVLRKCKLPVLTQEDIQNMNSPIAINNIKSVVKNLATKVTPARLEISLQKKKKKMLRGKQACHIIINHHINHGVRRNNRRGEREKRERRKKSGKEMKTYS